MEGSHAAGTRLAFVVALAVGTAGMLIGTRLDSGLVTAIVPISAMLGYLVVERVRDPATLDDPLFADSLYYLGFLLTLVALTVSLYLMGEDPDMSGIVHRFGVALITTVLGLTLRIMLSGFRRDTEDSLVDAEAAVEQAVRRLRERLDQFSTDLLTQQAAFNEAMKNAVEQASADLAGMVVASNGKIQAAADGLAETAAAGSLALRSTLEEELSATAASIQTQGGALTSALGTLARDVGNTPLPSDLFTKTLHEPLEDLVSAVENVSTRLNAELPDLEPFSVSLRESLAQLSADFRDLAQEDMRELQSTIQAAGSGLKLASSQLQTELDKVAKLAASPDGKQGLAALAAAAGAARAALEDLQRQQEGYAGALKEQTGVLQALQRSSSDTVKVTAEHREQTASNLRQSTQAVQRVFEELTASVSLLRESLDRTA